MSVIPRPTDNTDQEVIVGLPIVEVGLKLPSGAFSSFRTLGVLDSAELQKTLTKIKLQDFSSGVGVTRREVVNEFEPSLVLGMFDFSTQNMQLLFAAAAITAVGATVPSVVDEEIILTTDDRDFVDLDNPQLVEPVTAITGKVVTAEAVGTGTGTPFGETQGDFALDNKILVVANVSSYLQNGVERVSDIVAGGAPATGEIGIIEGAVATSGEITYFTGEGPPLDHAIVVTYLPTFTSTENTDYFVDPVAGRVRVLFSTNKWTAGQTLLVDYDHTVSAHDIISPFTQFVFNARARLNLLTNTGKNLIWPVPVVSISINDTAFPFTKDDFNAASLTITFLSDPTNASDPYGVLQIHPETP